MKNNEQVYDEKINPLMAQIIEICKEHEIPFAAQFVYNRNEETDEDFLCSSCITFDNKQIIKVYNAMTMPKGIAYGMIIRTEK